jgi:predicted nucleic acid-binding protein
LNRFVVDSSVAICWGLADETSPYADAVLQALQTHTARVPSLWPFEVANGLLMGERRGRLALADTQRVLADLAALPIDVELVTAERAAREVLDLARGERLTVYDAAYLELAMREGLPLATLDTQLKVAAAHVGVPEFDPS